VGTGDDEAGRILVVDDEEEIRRLSQLVPESAGYQCVVAPNTMQAQARLAEDEFDLLISDLRTPGESGLRLMQNARAAQVDVSTIILTSLDDRKAAATAIEEGAYGYITKPFRMNELLIGVENALRRRH
jgi:DNA-binding response OmpR family regulator